MDRPYLPTEIVCAILCFLDVRDLLHCVAASRFFRALIQDSSRLQVTIELAKHRMLSLLPPTHAPPFSSRLKLIRERERNWRSPQAWGPLTSLTLPPPTGTVYEFVGGVYANGWEDDTAGITFCELPSTEHDEPLKSWTHSIGPLKLADFTMDPAQDLLVLVALAPPSSAHVYNVHLRSFKTNDPHPDAAQPLAVLPCLPRMGDQQHPTFEATGAVRVQVAGDLVALLVKEVHDSVSAHLQIWNWRYGGPGHSCSLGTRTGIEDFTFLTDDTFLIVRPSGRFECYTFENPVSCSTTPTLRSSYSLPALQDGYLYWYICMSSNPAPGYLPRRENNTHRVYYPRPEERIHACCLYIFKPTGPGDHRVHSFVFFLNVKMFLEAPPPAPRDSYPLAPYAMRSQRTATREAHLRSLHSMASSAPVRTVPWEEWGPANTRWFDDRLTTDWQHALYGLRTVECIADAGIGSEAPAVAPPIDPNTLPTVNDLLNGNGFQPPPAPNANANANANGSNADTWRRPTQRYLRIRDYNPYALRLDNDTSHSPNSDSNSSCSSEEDSDEEEKENTASPRRHWTRRLVTTPSTTASRGVFVQDIVSALPYSEVVSREKYHVTDVMMDDCRILLMRRGRGGRLQGVDVLTM
uniref:F-box domain-containing protein n=1 Tax=Mycena chlorophos TaxID=658473 RepID=A0ABQ0M756_MYCCL|nr:predicted protein [Mycena chlorophos]